MKCGKCLTCDQRKVNTKHFSNQILFRWISNLQIFIFVFQRISEWDYLKKDYCVGQNKVIERITGYYSYLLYQKASDTICVANLHCYQSLLSCAN